MDYNFVEEILQECYISLRNRLNPLDTLPYMRPFTPGEKQKIKCELQNRGEGPANDELLNVVRTKPKSFVRLLESLKKNHNDGLLNELWTCIERYSKSRNLPSLADNLQREVEGLLQSDVLAIQGASGEGSLNTEEFQSRNQSATGTTPQITLAPDSRSSSVAPDSRSSSGINFLATSCASPDENNFEDMELGELDSTVGERLGKELEKPSADGKAGWEHVLKYLKQFKFTMRERISIKKASNPGEECLEFLIDKHLTVGQLKEALLMNNLQQANQILFGETDTRLHASSSEGDIRQLGSDNNRQNAPFTSLQFNNLNTEDGRQKPATGTKQIISSQSLDRSVGTDLLDTSGSTVFPSGPNVSPVSSVLAPNTAVLYQKQEPVDGNKQINSAQSSDRSDGTGIPSEILSPTDTSSRSSSSVFLRGPNVSPVSSVSAPNTGVRSPREITLSSLNTQDSSLRSSEGGSLKETRPITAVGDPEKEHAVLNADVEHNKLVYDRNLQADVIGNTSNSFGYIDIRRTTVNATHSQTTQSAENILDDGSHNTTENLEQATSHGQNQSAPGLRDPDLGMEITPAPRADQFRQAAEHETVTIDDSGGDTGEIGVQAKISEQQDVEIITTRLDNIVDLKTDSLQDSMVND